MDNPLKPSSAHEARPVATGPAPAFDRQASLGALVVTLRLCPFSRLVLDISIANAAKPGPKGVAATAAAPHEV